MTRAAIYARYSSEQQRHASIEDQVRICQARLDGEGWSLAQIYSDHGLSGASHLRPGYQQLLADARDKRFEILVAESLDRLSRDQEHVAALFKTLAYQGITVTTLAEGEITELHVGLKGAMSALYLKDLAQKTRRGLEGRVRAGRSAGGLCYGYAVAEGSGSDPHGARTIVDDEAQVVVRIFEDFASGLSPRAIAMALNRGGVPGPSGKTWGPSTIYGNWRRGTGILNNELYAGKLVWNRQRFVKDPETGRRQARPNPPEAWVIEDVPHLRIVDDALWQRVKNRQERTRHAIVERNSVRPERARRPNYLFSGLLTCGVCGGGYVLVGKRHYGCANTRNRGTCSNRLTIRRDVLEGTVLDGLRDQLLAPDLVAVFVAEYQRETRRLRAERQAADAGRERELATIRRRIRHLVDAISKGFRTPEMREELEALNARRDTLERSAPVPVEAAPLLHPGLAEIYRRKVAELTTALNAEELQKEAAALIRGLIAAIRLVPANGALLIELEGKLPAILALGQERQSPRSGGARACLDRQITLVAGARNQLNLLIFSPDFSAWRYAS